MQKADVSRRAGVRAGSTREGTAGHDGHGLGLGLGLGLPWGGWGGAGSWPRGLRGGPAPETALLAALALLAGSAAAGCDLSGPPDAPFRQAPPAAPNVHVVIEVWADGASAGWLADVLAAVDARDVPVVLVARPQTLTGPLALAARDAAGAGHELALRLDATAAVDLTDAKAARAVAKDVKRATGQRPRVAWSPLAQRRDEAVLGMAGFRTILSGAGGAAAAPREAIRFENQITEAVVLPSGVYGGLTGCGTDPRVGPFTPPAADRATVAMQASATTAVAVVRVGLDGSRGDATDATVLARWLDEVVLPSKVAVTSASATRVDTLRQGGAAAAERIAADTGGRLLSVDDVRAAAASLRDVDVLPRELHEGLTPTELYLALAMLLADRTEGAVVRLGALSGPDTQATSTLTGPTEVDRAALVATAAALVAALPKRIPAALPVGEHRLSAGEVLTAMASAVRGDDPVIARPIGSPDPHDPGLGWGSATLP